MTIDALANHLWQSTVFVLAIAVLAMALRRNRARVRYWLWFSASVKFCLPFALLVSLGSHLPGTPAAPPPPPAALSWSVAPFSQLVVAEPLPIVSPVPSAARSTAPAPGIPMPTAALITLWAAGFLIVVLIRFRLWRQVRAAVRSSRPWHVPGLTLPPDLEVRAVHGLLAPGVAGVWRPVLLVPAGIERQLTPAQLEAVLAHEGCHVRQRDHLTASLHMVVEAVFWFHPLVWWIGARLVQEREQACDEEVLRTGSSARVYAEAIFHVCRRYVQIPLANVTGIGGPHVRSRIEAIMDRRVGAPLSATSKAALATAAAVVLMLPLAFGAMLAGQVPAAGSDGTLPEFEVASVKPNASDRPAGSRIDVSAPGSVVATNVTVEQLVIYAYGLRATQVIGLPGWTRFIGGSRFDIVATLPRDASADERRLMMQHLLIERFGLRAGRETQDRDIYALVLARSDGTVGPSLRASAHDCAAFLAAGGDASAQHAPRDSAGRVLCTRSMSIGGVIRMIFGGAPVAELAERLEMFTDRPVFDRTGLAGRFDVELEFIRDEVPAAWAPAGDIPPPRLVPALREQLGLTLESRREPIDVLVIETIERPSED